MEDWPNEVEDWGVANNVDEETELATTPRLMDELIICIDTSVSTEGCYDYYNYVNNIISEATEQYENVKIISWNTEAKYCVIEELEPDGGTQPVSFLRLLRNKDTKYHLIVTTDGELFDREVNACNDVLNNCNILSNILSFKIYFIGDINEMNLRLSDLFININDKRIIINDQEPIKIMNIDVEKLTYNDYVHNDNIIGSVLELIKLQPDKKDELRIQFCRSNTRILAEMAKHTSIKEYYESDDIDGCVDFVRTFDPSDKIKFQRVMSKLIQICTENEVDLYSLSHLINTKSCREALIVGNHDEEDVEPTDIDSETHLIDYTEDNDIVDHITCDITLIKSNNPCAEIVLLGNDEDKILSDKESKRISQNPWLILNDQELINKIVKHVGHYTYDLITKNQMDEAYTHYSSAFTRQEIYGVFIFHNNSRSIDYNQVFKNNNRAISFIFNNKYKLPGNKSVWNILFLYILGKYHPHWKQYSRMIHEEIVNILPKLSSFVTLNPLLNPPIIDSLDACLWYIVKVSHRSFPNSGKNILRNIEGSERLIDIYEYIYPDCDINDIKYKVKVWNTWKYLLRNRTSKKLRLEVISQYQNHIIIDENIILLSGKSEKQSIDLKPLHTKNLFNYMMRKPAATLFEKIPFHDLDKGDAIPVEGVYDSVAEVDHVKICLTTCRPLYACPVSKVVWKDCAEKFDVKKESFFRGFTRFCEKHKRYPENIDEFLVHHSNQYNFAIDAGSELNGSSDYLVYGKNIRECFKAVVERFSEAMKKYSTKDFIWTYNRNCEKDNRIRNENNCNCGVH